MKVFISHVFSGDDESFAAVLKEDLGAAGMDGYMAEKTQRYDLLIHDKIMQAIDESEWLVGIITKRSRASPSVHEEIGYAFGKGIRVALMVEEGVREGEGVFIHGREQETFSPQEFGDHSKKVVEFIKNSPRAAPRQVSLSNATTDLLEKRCLLDVKSADFAKNEHFDGLYSGSLSDAKKPVVLFTSCPHDLATRHDVTALEFMEWVESTARVDVGGQQVSILGAETDVNIGTLYIFEKRDGDSGKNIRLYREFQSTGFMEWGTSYLFFDQNAREKTELHLCYTIGELLAFLTSVRLFYKKINLDVPFTLLVSIRNTRMLDLGNYGDKSTKTLHTIDLQLSRNSTKPATNHDHIQIKHVFNSISEMTDENIASVAKTTAKHICNAYGERTPRCYDKHESFLWRLHDEVSSRATGDGRI